jgi:hypothetical protein
VPGNFFQSLGLRQFLVNAYPYSSINQAYETVDGIPIGVPYGGAIPYGMGSYYPTNISWPSGNPTQNTTAGSALWWWDQATNSSSPYYDARLASCTAHTPCQYPTFSISGDTTLDGMYSDWNSEVASLSGDALQPYTVDLSSTQYDEAITSSGGAPLTIFDDGWAADYPDPSDFMTPVYTATGTYGSVDGFTAAFSNATYHAASCPTNYTAWSNLSYYATHVGAIPEVCQGAAYDTMAAWVGIAADEGDLAARTLDYNLIEQIADGLGLYVYNPQVETYVTYADWIDPGGIDTNPMFGGNNIQLWYDWGYLPNATTYPVTFSETGLPTGSTWGVAFGNQSTQYSSGSSLEVTSVPNGTYPYTVFPPTGYTADPTNSNVTVDGAAVSVTVPFNETGPTFAVSFPETGLPNGTAWNVTIAGSLYPTNSDTVTASLPNGSYPFSVGAVPTTLSGGTPSTYVPSPANGSFTVQGRALTIDIAFALGSAEYAVSVDETGLAAGTSWSAGLSGTSHSSTTSQIDFSVANGTYTLQVPAVTGYNVSYDPTVEVAGAPVLVAVNFTAIRNATYAVSFLETGLGTGAAWGVTATNSGTGQVTSADGTTAEITLRLPDGGYTLSANVPNGYRVVLTPSSITVDGASPATISVTYSTVGPIGTSSSPTFSIVTDVAIGIVLLASVAAVWGYSSYRWSRRRSEGERWVREMRSEANGPGDEPPK